MTDEEMAEEWIKEHSGLIGSYKFVKYDYDSLKQAFLAGLKAGRPEWHDLRKNPTDLPERINSTSPISKTVLNQIGTSCYYHYGLKCWHNWSFTKIATPIAWCEISTFTDKE